MSWDGHQLRESWSSALTDALSSFRHHLTSAQSSSWKRVPIPVREGSSSSSNGKGKEKASALPDVEGVLVHKKSTKGGELYRVMVDIPATEDVADLEVWKTVLSTPELRREWDPSVEESNTLEMFDPFTRIVKTKFSLGWPANPRDAVMISRTFSDPSTVIDISTSLPRSQDEPSYLRPSPPFVRSSVILFAWCVQKMNASQQESQSGPSEEVSVIGRFRITCFWQHDLRTVWNIGASSIPQQLSAMMIGVTEVVKRRQKQVPVLSGYGLGVSIDKISFDNGRNGLTVDYSIIPEDDGEHHRTSLQGLHELHAIKEQRRLQRSVEVMLPTAQGWDIRVSTRASSDAVAQLPWKSTAYRIPEEQGLSRTRSDRLCFQVQHSQLLDDHSVLKVKLSVEYSAALSSIRLNGLPHDIQESIENDLKMTSMSDQLTKDASSVANVSLQTGSSLMSAESEASTSSSALRPPMLRTNTGTKRTPTLDKTILSRVRRSYIYFSSLLQEPDAKWKTNSESKGVSVTQLDSIDPTLVVFKAEATFVGIGLWDLYSAVVTPGARAYWDKQYEDAVLLNDVNELSELWHYKTKPAWPVTGRDAVVLKTVYKSPTTVHVFAFSVDDTHLFDIPPADPNIIRTQVDLQGWAIEALSPTTTQLTLLEQSDPKGWSGKSSIAQQMIANVAGVGEFAIKFGGPPMVTRLGGAKAESYRYEHDRGVFRAEYQASSDRRPSPIEGSSDRPDHQARQNSVDGMQGILSPEFSFRENSLSTSVECELRCDVDTWTSSLDIVVDPPPQSLSCLRRHRLSVGGGGLWLTVGHDISFSSDERILVIVRRAPFTAGKEKGVVMVNGKRIPVDVEDLPESQVKALSKQKRVKPVRVPLDQPPVLGVIRRRRADADEASLNCDVDSGSKPLSTPKAPSPLSNFFTTAMESARSTTQQAVAALTPPAPSAVDVSFAPGKEPMHFALDALHFAQSYHRGSFRDNWILVAEKGMQLHRRQSPEISPLTPLHKGEKVLEGVTAEEVASVVCNLGCRKNWDDRFISGTVLQEYGAGSQTAFMVAKGGFPFRDRGFYLASLIARDSAHPSSASIGEGDVQSPAATSGAIYCISASFNPESLPSSSTANINSTVLPVGRVYLDAWIIQTLDPYTAENYPIPSTRCTRLSAVDYAGSIPATVTALINSSLPRCLLAVEAFVKGLTPSPELVLPAAGYSLSSEGPEAVEGWKVQRDDDRRTLLSQKVSFDEKTFSADFVLSLLQSDPISPNLQSSEPDVGTPKPRRTVLPSSRPTSPDTRTSPSDVSLSTASPSHRHRRMSSTATTANRSPSGSIAMRSKSRDVLRGSSSAFTVGKDFKPTLPSDFVVAEVAIDLRFSPEGYEVYLSSFLWSSESNDSDLRSGNQLVLPSLDERLKPPLESSDGDTIDGRLPLSCLVFNLSSSPLYTSGASSSETQTMTCHVLRLTLPTSQYEVPTIVDPLTGETRSAPPKPAWLLHLSDDKNVGNCAVVRIFVCPLSGNRRQEGKTIVFVDGNIANIAKEAPKIASGIAYDHLEKIGTWEGSSAVPSELRSPLAISDLLVSNSSPESADAIQESGVDNASSQLDGKLIDSPSNSTPVDEFPPPPVGDPSASKIASSTSKLQQLHQRIGLWNWWSQSHIEPAGQSKNITADDRVGRKGEEPTPGQFPSSPCSSRMSGSLSTTADSPSKSRPVSQSATSFTTQLCSPRFSASTLFAAVLIAFLVGSLLRSLLSPADFIYVVTDLRDVPGYSTEGTGEITNGPHGGSGRLEPGWREIKRLLEVKYLVGGWDFQVAMVRRH